MALSLSVFMTRDAWPQSSGQSQGPRDVAVEKPVAETTLVKASDGIAVIRVAKGPMERVTVGDRIGLTKAVVTEISSGRLVLEEPFTGRDGKANRALIIVKEGETGGTRYLQRADEPRFTGIKPLVIAPPAAPESAKPAPKKPPQM
jgi:hypothetical protein